MSPPPRRLTENPTDIRKSLGHILGLLTNYKLKLTLTIICAILSTAFSIIGPMLIGLTTTTIYNGINLILNHTGTIDINRVTMLLSIAVVLYIFSALFNYLQSWFLTEISTDISYNLRKQIMDKINHLSMSDVDSNKRGDILSRMSNDVDSLQVGITSTFSQMLTAIITIIGVFIMMVYINIWLTVATIILIPISFIVIQVITRRSQKYFRDQLKYKGKTNAQIEEAFTGHDIIRVYNQEENIIDSFNEDNKKWYEYEWKSQYLSTLSGPIMTFISNLNYVVVAVLGSVFAIQGVIAVGDILAFFQYIDNFSRPIQQITRVMGLVQTAMASIERIVEFLDIDDEENKSKLEIKNMHDNITFNHVCFGYDENPVINDLTFTVKRGEKIALIGETGAGKTTIVKLLMRFYDVDSGAILIDGVNINEYDKNSLRSLVGMVLQDTWLFNDTIMNNIRYGNLSASDDMVVEVARKSTIDDFIRKLPDGYDTVLNEDTDNISQGQKQLLTIARTMLSNRQILVLDEATSSVDTRTEKLIQKAMDKLMENKTSFIIAHRLSTVRNADRILVIDDGRIVEQGSHDELIDLHGVYYNTLHSQ